jgi:hypothetical protein
MAGKRWTEKELQLLKEVVPEHKRLEDVLEFFDRSSSSIQSKIERLGLKFKDQRTEWTEEEIELLKEVYPHADCVESILCLFPNRNERAIVHKANRLGLQIVYWTDSQIAMLERLYPNTSNQDIADLIGKTKRAVDIFAHRNGLKKSDTYISSISGQKFAGKSHSEKTKELMHIKWEERKSDPNWTHPWLGRKHDKSSKDKMSNFWDEHYKTNDSPFKGCKHTQESIKKMSRPRNWTKESLDAIRKAVMERNPFGVKIKYQRKDGVTVNLDSSYELRIAQACDDFGYNWERNTSKVRFKWFDNNGKEHYYYPDFIIWFEGEQYIVEAKGEHLMDLDDTISKSEAAMKECGDSFLMVGEEEIQQFEKHGWFE